jgi:hypothetical protein
MSRLRHRDGPDTIDAELAVLTERLDHHRARTAAAHRRYELAHAADDRWRDWNTRTGAVRRAGRIAAGILTARTDRTGTRLSDLVAGQRRAADRASERIRRAVVGAERERLWREDQASNLRAPNRPGNRGQER